MAMKTVISTNMPQATQLGISIIIDQDQAPNSRLDHRKLSTELGKNESNDVEVSKKREMSPKSPATKTFIDINRNNVMVNGHQIDDSQQNGVNYEHYDDNDAQRNNLIKETGYTTTKTATSTTTTVTTTAATTIKAATKTFPPSLGERGKLEKVDLVKTTANTHNDVVDRNYAAAGASDGDGDGLLVGKFPLLIQTQQNTLNEVKSVSIAHNDSDSDSNHDDNNQAPIKQFNNGTINTDIVKKTVIKCNIENDNANDDDHNDEFSKWHYEESQSISIGNDANNDNGDDDGCGQLLSSSLRVVATQSQKIHRSELDEVSAVSRLTKAEDCASAAAAATDFETDTFIDTEKVKEKDTKTITKTEREKEKETRVFAKKIFEPEVSNESHVVKIQIKPKADVSDLNSNSNTNSKTDKQVTVVQVNENITPKIQNNISNRTELSLNLGTKMVQKQPSTANSITTGNTTVTELNVSNQNYLYYTMSSGQFSPCDTLDSGTGSDLESNGNSGTPITMQSPKGINGVSSSGDSLNNAPKLELHLKTTKIRINNGGASKTLNLQNGEHLRASSLTDSEESESSSLSCDSLHSTEYVRQSSASPSGKKLPKTPSSAFLPDSLLRDIRDRKFPTNDFESKYGNQTVTTDTTVANVESVETVSTVKIAKEAAEHAKFLKECKAREEHESTNDKRTSLPPCKTFIINTENGTFVDTKMNSMPRKYEADKYYNFHVNEHDNFHSFDRSNSNGNGNGSNNSNNNGHGNSLGNGNGSLNDDEASLSEYDIKSMQDDDFAGYKDIRCSSATSTIRSSKGTVRGVKNRVRNGIATFLQMQQPHLKNYIEKDVGKVVLYTTSMGIIRDTYAKCANVKQILRTLLVKFEERDVFMSVEYQAEIKNRMHSDLIRVPQLFVEGQHIGDAETVERLNESGELRQLLKPYKSIATTYTCQTCGGYRLLPCPSCNGSKKSVHRNHFTAEFVALKCMNCDEVGLVKCHNC